MTETNGNRQPVTPDPHRCGVGRRGECCIFLTAGAEGFCCARYGPLHAVLVGCRPTMSAQRMPEQPYPDCMTFPGRTA